MDRAGLLNFMILMAVGTMVLAVVIEGIEKFIFTKWLKRGR